MKMTKLLLHKFFIGADCERHLNIGKSARQKGFTLLEALIAFVILAGGLLALFRYHATTTESTGTAKVRAEAIALGEQKLEELRSYLSLDNFQDDTVTAAGLGEYNGVDYAANFTRSWTVAGANPREIAVTVTWNDRAGDTQTVQVSSLLWGVQPTQAATEFVGAMAFHDGDVPQWPAPDPLDDGTGYGGGKVTIKYQGDDGNEYDSLADAAEAGTVVNSFDLYFTGTIESIDGGALLDVQLDGGPNVGIETCLIDPNISAAAAAFDPTLYDPETSSPTYTDHFGLQHPGAWVDDSDPAVIVPDPYLYSCKIPGISINDTWQGTITYVGEQGVPGSPDDVVCIPNEGTTTLTFSADSPADLQLGIVLVDKKNLCNAFK